MTDPREDTLSLAGLDWSKVPNRETDDAHPVNVLAGIWLCAAHWTPEVRIIGNVRAGDIVRAIDWLAAPTPPAAEAPGQEPVAVKPLEWEHNCFGRGLGVAYQLSKGTPGLFSVVLPIHTREMPLAAAQEAAQADYEQRIRSALVSAPTKQELVGFGLVEDGKLVYSSKYRTHQEGEQPLYAAPPTYADAEAKGFERGIEAAANWHDGKSELFCPSPGFQDAIDFHGIAAKHIRSLAPAASNLQNMQSAGPKESGQ